jgi:hypothetical protein
VSAATDTSTSYLSAVLPGQQPPPSLGALGLLGRLFGRPSAAPAPGLPIAAAQAAPVSTPAAVSPWAALGTMSLAALALGGGLIYAYALMKGLGTGGYLSNMKNKEVVALMAASLLSGPEYQKKLAACSNSDEINKIVKGAVAVAETILDASTEFEADAELKARRAEIDKKVLEAHDKLSKISKDLDEARSGADDAMKTQREAATKAAEAALGAIKATADAKPAAPPAQSAS